MNTKTLYLINEVDDDGGGSTAYVDTERNPEMLNNNGLSYCTGRSACSNNTTSLAMVMQKINSSPNFTHGLFSFAVVRPGQRIMKGCNKEHALMVSEPAMMMRVQYKNSYWHASYVNQDSEAETVVAISMLPEYAVEKFLMHHKANHPNISLYEWRLGETVSSAWLHEWGTKHKYIYFPW